MHRIILGSVKRRGVSLALLVAVGVLGFSAVAAADTLPTISFDGYAAGNINGQNGWSNTGSYDANVLSTSRFGFGQALQISNAKTSGSFGDQTFSPGLAQPAGESALRHFEASFNIATTSDDVQPGLAISVSPDNGQGARMSYLRFVDAADGVDVFFTDASFNQQRIATLSRTSAHTIRLMINFKTGPGNDDVKVFIDGKKGISATTWEDYYRYDSEQSAAGNQVSPVSKMLFRAGGNAASPTEGQGFLIDNLTLSSS
jgi:hypothetical protein